MRIKPLYLLLKIIIPPALKYFYFKKLVIQGIENVPATGPVIFAPNHQNAFMDALLVGSLTKRNPWYLTRASVFKKPVARFFLHSLRMIAIFRFRDGLKQVKRNDETIDTCVDILRKGESLLIFPEGDHDMRWSLLPMQKGIARISIAYLKNADAETLRIVPVGIQYEDHTRFQSEVLLSFGEPIVANEYQNDFEYDTLKGTVKLLEDLRKKISSLIIDIQPVDQYDEKLESLKKVRLQEKDLVKRLASDQELLKDIDESQKTFEPEKPPGNVLIKVLGFPVFLYGLINNLISYLLVKAIVKKFVREEAWIASIKFAAGLFITPVVYILQSLILLQLTGSILAAALYFISLPYTGILAYRYSRIK